MLACLACLLLAYHFGLSHFWISASCAVLMALAFLGMAVRASNAVSLQAERMILAIKQKDFSSVPADRSNSLLNAIKGLFEQSRDEQSRYSSQELVFSGVLNELETGIAILERRQGAWWVFFINPEILTVLKVPHLNRWEDYRTKVPDFYNIIEQSDFQNSQNFWDVSIQGEARRSYSIRTRRVEQGDVGFFIITMESVQRIVEQKEKMAWNSLMKVISHELLNTLTPVNSLIQNLHYLAQQDLIDDEGRAEIRDSLRIVSSKSEQLLSFINDYRRVAELPKPQLQFCSLNVAVHEVLKLLRVQLEVEHIKIKVDEEPLMALMDIRMVQQALVNLLLNAIYALSEVHDKQIFIRVFKISRRIVLSVTDNGPGVPREIEHKIFLPFFTTRQQGSGIGLTLAKHIMEAHNGYLHFESASPGSTFELWFTL